MQQYSSEGNPVELEIVSGHLLFVDPLYLLDIRENSEGLEFIDCLKNPIKFIQHLESIYFPYGGGDLLGYKKVSDGCDRLIIPVGSILNFCYPDKADAQASFEKEITTFASDSGMCLVIDLSNLRQLLEVLVPDKLMAPDEESILSYVGSINKTIRNKGWACIQNPGLGQGFDFVGSGSYRVFL